MSALPPKADISCGPSDVRFVPKADIAQAEFSAVIEVVCTQPQLMPTPFSTIRPAMALGPPSPFQVPVIKTVSNRDPSTICVAIVR
jgi:hypothetical protein